MSIFIERGGKSPQHKVIENKGPDGSKGPHGLAMDHTAELVPAKDDGLGEHYVIKPLPFNIQESIARLRGEKV